MNELDQIQSVWHHRVKSDGRLEVFCPSFQNVFVCFVTDSDSIFFPPTGSRTTAIVIYHEIVLICDCVYCSHSVDVDRNQGMLTRWWRLLLTFFLANLLVQSINVCWRIQVRLSAGGRKEHLQHSTLFCTVSTSGKGTYNHLHCDWDGAVECWVSTIFGHHCQVDHPIGN